MRGAGVKRTVVIAYLGTEDGPVLNPLRYKSNSLRRILMFCCGPRSGPTACKSRASTVALDSHVATGKTKIYKYVYRMFFIGIALAGMLASVRSRHSWVNLLDPGHQPLPIQHQLDILDWLVNWYLLLVKYNIEIRKISTNSCFFTHSTINIFLKFVGKVYTTVCSTYINYQSRRLWY